MGKTGTAVLFFALGYFVQTYRKNSEITLRVNKAVKRTEQEINEGLVTIIAEIEKRGGGLNDLRLAVEAIEENEK